MTASPLGVPQQVGASLPISLPPPFQFFPSCLVLLARGASHPRQHKAYGFISYILVPGCRDGERFILGCLNLHSLLPQSCLQHSIFHAVFLLHGCVPCSQELTLAFVTYWLKQDFFVFLLKNKFVKSSDMDGLSVEPPLAGRFKRIPTSIGDSFDLYFSLPTTHASLGTDSFRSPVPHPPRRICFPI